ncbi:hypothetical protein J7E71_24240 [Mesobacillus foraminis]|uniref:hypothetical protein n=1 Tax=Mesobacillus foraminis TaxID=279826 RepID=UPI001BE9CC91|nr:hypothetical protein [Mesobacillus foraminis]MBT2758985.1 hypothetical protein [Mesobacillus foraminis]
MSILAILPIVTLLFFGCILIIAFKLGKQIFILKITHWLLLAYTAVLLLASGFIPIIMGETKSVERTAALDEGEAENELHEKLSNGDIGEINPDYLIGESIYNYSQEMLKIDSNSMSTPLIYIERSTENHDISAFIYMIPMVADGFELTGKLKPYQLEIEENKLSIVSTRQDIKLGIFSSSFTAKQFKREPGNEFSFSGGSQYLYLRVPEDLKIEAGEGVSVEYLEG